MLLKNLKWIFAAVFFLIGSVSCVTNNKLIIENTEGISNVFTIGGRQLLFPVESEISYSPMAGAAWDLSGDLLEIVNIVLLDLESNSSLIIPADPDLQFQVTDVSIEFGDGRADGSHSMPFLSLGMELRVARSGVIIQSCKLPPSHPNLDEWINHGLFTSTEKIKALVLLGYEKLVAEALHESLVTGFKCLAEKLNHP